VVRVYQPRFASANQDRRSPTSPLRCLRLPATASLDPHSRAARSSIRSGRGRFPCRECDGGHRRRRRRRCVHCPGSPTGATRSAVAPSVRWSGRCPEWSAPCPSRCLQCRWCHRD